MAPIEMIFGREKCQTNSSNRQKIRNVHFLVNGIEDKTTMVTLTNGDDKERGGTADLCIRDNCDQTLKFSIKLASGQEDRSQNFHGQPIIFRGK